MRDMAVLISTGQYSPPSLIEKLRHFEQRTKGTVRRRKDRKENTYKLRKTKNIQGGFFNWPSPKNASTGPPPKLS